MRLAHLFVICVVWTATLCVASSAAKAQPRPLVPTPHLQKPCNHTTQASADRPFVKAMGQTTLSLYPLPAPTSFSRPVQEQTSQTGSIAIVTLFSLLMIADAVIFGGNVVALFAGVGRQRYRWGFVGMLSSSLLLLVSATLMMLIPDTFFALLMSIFTAQFGVSFINLLRSMSPPVGRLTASTTSPWVPTTLTLLRF